MKKSILAGIAAGGVLALLLAGCSSAKDKGQAVGDEALTKITVGVAYVAANAPIFLGIDKGYFKEEGLDVEIQQVTGGSAAVPSVVSGAWEFSNSNPVSIMIARDKGIDVKFVSPGASVATGDNDATALLVRSDSDIKSPADLGGKTVAVNTLGNVTDLTVRYAVEQDGGDGASIKFVEVPFSDVEAALENKQVDAGVTTEPFVTRAIGQGARVLSSPFATVSPTLNATGYFALGKTIENDPKLVEAFQRAMSKSLNYSQENPEEVRAIVGTYATIDADLLNKMVLNTFSPKFDRDGLAKLGAAAFEYGILSKVPVLDELLP
jgi:NitT/TauT family transport system substrate-binding protein